jgi:dTMP kinase
MSNPEPAPSASQPVFIDFEGIDGSGKTTLSNRLADYLRAQGIDVHHARDGGVFRSKISRAIRELTRDPSFLRMTHITELLLYVARDAQMIDEYIRPHLTVGQVVFSDRYLYSAVTHSHHGRGIDRRVVDTVVEAAAGGLWPDLVVYCDVDPLTSRVRKRIQKVREHRLRDFGRKGLMGIGFREQMREGFLELAAENPEKWLVIDNANSSIEESLQRIFNRVREVLERKGYERLPDPCWADLSAAPRKTPKTALVAEVRSILECVDPELRMARSLDFFFQHLRSLAASLPAHAALHVCGFDVQQAHDLRESLIEAEPALIAYSLRGLRSEQSMNFRERLLRVEPFYVAQSLSGMALYERAIEMRERLADVVPEQIALALRGNDTEEAWALRARLKKDAPSEVLMSLRGIDSERAWEIRDKRAEKRTYFPEFLESLGGLDTDRAWQWREELAEEFLPWVLLSLRGLKSDRSWEWRRRYVLSAPKFIIKSIGRSEDPRAFELRSMAKTFAKEVLDSVSGLDSGPAWELRLALADKWPNTAVSSLGAGNQSERAWRFRWEQLSKYPDNLLLLKHIAKAALRSQDQLADESLGDDEEDVDFT